MSEQQEHLEQTPPMSIDDLLADLQGFGVEECEELLTFETKKRKVLLRITNLATEDEVTALLRAEASKGPGWINEIKVQCIARAIVEIDGVKITPDMYVLDPIVGEQVQAKVALTNVVRSWGTVLVGVIWKILMVHTQRLEDRLFESFPQSVVMTDVEKRFMERAMEELEEMGRAAVRDTLEKIVESEEAIERAKDEAKV
jgi:hypothetical protein